MRLAGASLLLNAVTSENTQQAMRLRNMGDVWNVGRVNDEVTWKLRVRESPPLSYFVWVESLYSEEGDQRFVWNGNQNYWVVWQVNKLSTISVDKSLVTPI